MEPTKQKSPFLKTCLIIGAIVLLLIIGFAAFFFKVVLNQLNERTTTNNSLDVPETNLEYTNFIDSYLLISFDIPKTWEMTTQADDELGIFTMLLTSPLDDTATLGFEDTYPENIVFQTIPFDGTIDELESVLTSILLETGGFTVSDTYDNIEAGEFGTGGVTYMALDSTVYTNEKGLIALTVKDGIGYYFSISYLDQVNEKYLSIFGTIIKSFKWLM